MIEAVLTLSCQKCRQILMQQKVSCSLGSYTTINVDELQDFAGACCTRPKRTARVEFQERHSIVEAETGEIEL
jgi:hypothetical protein